MSPIENVVETRFGEINKLLKRFASKHRSEIFHLGLEQDDFVQDVIENILKRQGLKTYDETKTQSFEALIYRIAMNQLIDEKRKKGSKSRTGIEVNIDQPIMDKEGDEVSLHDVIPDENAEMVFIMVEMIESAPETQISPNYKLSWRELIRRTFSESPLEIAKSLGISESRISQLQKLAFQKFWA